MHAEVIDYDSNMLTPMARLAALELEQSAQNASANVWMLVLHNRL